MSFNLLELNVALFIICWRRFIGFILLVRTTCTKKYARITTSISYSRWALIVLLSVWTRLVTLILFNKVCWKSIFYLFSWTLLCLASRSNLFFSAAARASSSRFFFSCSSRSCLNFISSSFFCSNSSRVGLDGPFLSGKNDLWSVEIVADDRSI